MDREQHWTAGAALAGLRRALSSVDLGGSHVLEIGAGRGAVTELLLELGARHVTAFEIEPGLCPIRDERLTLREEDASRADLSFAWDRLVSVPPYELLPLLAELVGARANPKYLLMIPEKPSARSRFPGAHVIATFDGASFDPPARGNHVLIEQGLR